METDEMKDELAEAANDMGYIARRAQIAASNLRAVADALPLGDTCDPCDRRTKVLAHEAWCARLAAEATSAKQDIAWTLAEFSGKGAE